MVQMTDRKEKEEAQPKPNPKPHLAPLHTCDVRLPSNLMIRVCSHFPSDRKGTIRKIEQAVRRKNKSGEDCYRPQRRPQSLFGSLCLTSTKTMLTKTSECNHLTFSNHAECSKVLVWQYRPLRQIRSADPHGLCPIFSVQLHLKSFAEMATAGNSESYTMP